MVQLILRKNVSKRARPNHINPLNLCLEIRDTGRDWKLKGDGMGQALSCWLAGGEGHVQAVQVA